MDIHDILGQQHDDLAAERYRLAKTLERTEDFADCRTPVELFNKGLSLRGEAEFRQSLTQIWENEFPNISNFEKWLEIAIPLIQTKDNRGFEDLMTEMTVASAIRKKG
jgi:hypothetical protein